MSIKPGDLVKYKSAAAPTGAAAAAAAVAAYRKFKWTRQQCADNLIGLVTKIKDDRVFIHWFCLDRIIWEWGDYLKKVSS